MCGITGFIGEGNQETLVQMTNALIHRGPDDIGIFIDPDKLIYLGHRRLSIIDIETGHQPLWDKDKTIGVIYNGEIYNHQELRHELEQLGHIFITHHSDTEVLIHGYKEWGPQVVNRLNGMWAFAIYDTIHHIICLSRDRFGKNPFIMYTLKMCLPFHRK